MKSVLGLFKSKDKALGDVTQITQAIVAEHNRLLGEVSSGKPRTRGGGSLGMHDLIKALLKQHENEIAVARMQLPVGMKKLKEEWVLDAMEEPLWHVGDANIARRGGPEHEVMLAHAEECRMQNDIISHSASDIKQDIQLHETKMLEVIDDLRTSNWGPIEIDIRRRVCAHMRAMEHADFQLASVREEQIQNIEQIRVAKVGIWRLFTHADVNNTISELELAMLAGRYEPQQLVSMDAKLRKEKDAMEVDMAKTWDRVQKLAAECKKNEATLALDQGDPWNVKHDTEDMHLQLWKLTFELQTLAWKRSHVRGKQLATLENRWKVFHAGKMFLRQEETTNAINSGDAKRIGSLCERIDGLNLHIQDQAKLTKMEIGKLLERVMDAQTKLRAKKTEQTSETDALRDEYLATTFAVMVEDIRLAWLRKEGLQIVELSGLLRKTLANAEDQEWLRRLGKPADTQTPFQASRWSVGSTNKGGCFSALGTMCSRKRS